MNLPNNNLPQAIILGLTIICFVIMILAVRRSDRDKARMLDERDKLKDKK